MYKAGSEPLQSESLSWLVKSEFYWRVLGASSGSEHPLDLTICDALQRSNDQLKRQESR